MDGNIRLLLVGASGLVGRHTLEQALADSRVASVVAPSRRALPAHPKLFSPQVAFDMLDPGAIRWRADAVICTLGTTMRTAGPAERLLVAGLKVAGPLLPARWRLNPAQHVARALLAGAISRQPGTHIVAADLLV